MENEKRPNRKTVSPSRQMICSACVDIREFFPQYNFCFDCVKTKSEKDLSALEKWLRHLDICPLENCPNLCAEGQFLSARESAENLRIWAQQNEIKIPTNPARGN